MRSRRRWFFRAEVLVLICLLGICVIQSEVVPLDTVKAEVLRQVVKVDRDELKAYRFLGRHYRDTEQPLKAVEAYQGVVRLEPTDASAFRELGEAYEQCGQHAAAVAAYERAADIEPNESWPYMLLAYAYRDQQRHEEALEALNRAIALHPDISALYVIRGELLEEAARPSEAFAAYERAVTLKPDNGPAHLHLARAYLQKGDRESAQKEYGILKALDQDLANELLPIMGGADQE